MTAESWSVTMANLEHCVGQALSHYERIGCDSDSLDEELYSAGQRALQCLRAFGDEDQIRRIIDAFQHGLNSFIPSMFEYKRNREEIETARYHAGDALVMLAAPAAMIGLARYADISQWTGMLAYGTGTAAIAAGIIYLGRKASIIGGREKYLQNLDQEYAAKRQALIDSVVKSEVS
ncbi:hypothetical protein HY642_05865 [Candidatus Woesearchaeota archaeon]|nr:hypothetical protein [Candidatus Woesearchaeota archaeon]